MDIVIDRLEVCNVKIHFKIPGGVDLEDLLQAVDEGKGDRVKVHSNFVSIRAGKLALVIFPRSGHVNLSGVRDFEGIKAAVNEFNHQFDTNICESNIVVDNSTASGKVCLEGVSLKNLATAAAAAARGKRPGTRVSIRPHCFPSAVLRTRGEPTVILFANGNFVIVGGKTPESVDRALETLCAIISASQW